MDHDFYFGIPVTFDNGLEGARHPESSVNQHDIQEFLVDQAKNLGRVRFKIILEPVRSWISPVLHRTNIHKKYVQTLLFHGLYNDIAAHVIYPLGA
jgi:hypothetical protein